MFSRNKILKPVEIPKFDLKPIKLQRLAFVENSSFHSKYLFVEPNLIEEIKSFDVNVNLIDWIGPEFDGEEFLNYHEVIKVTRK